MTTFSYEAMTARGAHHHAGASCACQRPQPGAQRLDASGSKVKPSAPTSQVKSTRGSILSRLDSYSRQFRAAVTADQVSTVHAHLDHLDFAAADAYLDRTSSDWYHGAGRNPKPIDREAELRERAKREAMPGGSLWRGR